MSAWTRFRDRITARLLHWAGLDDIDDAFGGVTASTPPEPPDDTAAPDLDLPRAASADAAGDCAADGAPCLGADAARGVFDWSFGGVDGSRAAVDDRCKIDLVRVSPDGLALRWRSDIPADWRRDNGLIIAALFCWDGARWRGGKFDWIDRARSSRDAKNIRAGYRGWNAALFDRASRFAFCVLSADARRRSAFATWEGAR